MFSRRKGLVATVIAALTMAMLVLAPASASAATCGQHSQAWIKTDSNQILHSDLPSTRVLTVPAGTRIYHTGIVVPGTIVRFQYANLDANTAFWVNTVQASGNCVIAHEKTVLDTSIFGGTRWGVFAVWVAWEDNQIHSKVLGTLIVT
ncbi:MAG: hypothetical protein ACREX8_08080 [Gammaproteobacteria bacterium]